MPVREKVENLRRRIKDAAEKTGSDPSAITLVAVTKNVPPAMILEAIEAGITDIGENRIQEAQEKRAGIKAKFPQVRWHMIGHLQRNKVGQALDMFDIIQSVDSGRLVEEISKRAQRTVPILIEVNTSGETAKFGIEPERAVELVRFAAAFSKIKVQGLMTMGLLTGNPEDTRPGFARLRELRDEISRVALPGVEMRYLSMGMTDDFEVAVEEGANLVRIGRAIFKEGE